MLRDGVWFDDECAVDGELLVVYSKYSRWLHENFDTLDVEWWFESKHSRIEALNKKGRGYVPHELFFIERITK